MWRNRSEIEEIPPHNNDKKGGEDPDVRKFVDILAGN